MIFAYIIHGKAETELWKTSWQYGQQEAIRQMFTLFDLLLNVVSVIFSTTRELILHGVECVYIKRKPKHTVSPYSVYTLTRTCSLNKHKIGQSDLCFQIKHPKCASTHSPQLHTLQFHLPAVFFLSDLMIWASVGVLFAPWQILERLKKVNLFFPALGRRWQHHISI